MNACSHHIFQILTKRSKRLSEISDELTWSENIWIGVTIESEKYLERIDDLIKVPGYVRFVSCEPLLSPLNKLPLDGIKWVIVGGESGPGHRPMNKEWVISIRNQCKKGQIPFFFKQWGGFHRKKNGRLLDGKIYGEIPSFIFKSLALKK